MKKLVIIILLLYTSCSFSQNSKGWGAFLRANLFNKNVYKTQDSLLLIPVYKDNGGSEKIKNLGVLSMKDTMTLKLNDNDNFIRYKVLSSGDDGTFIRILKDLYIHDGIISKNKSKIDAHDYVFKFASTKEPVNNYQASVILVGKPLTLPVRLRNSEFTGTFNLSYAFGWKVKLGNHPFHYTYLHFVPYCTGVSVQKYYSKEEDGGDSVKQDELSLTYYSGGVIFQWEKFNIGILAGKDMMFGNKKDWVHNHDWWVGLGLGYDLIKEKN